MSTKDFSSKQERKFADLMGWSTVAASGARDFHAGDVRNQEWLGECKTHVDPGHKISFKLSVWSKLEKEARSEFKYPVYIVDDGSQDMKKTWCMFNAMNYQFRDLISRNDDKDPEIRGSASVSFNHDDMIGRYKMLDGEHPVLMVMLGARKLGIMPAVNFAEVFGSK